MIKYRYIFTTMILFLFLFLFGIFIWRISILFYDLSLLFLNKETTTELGLNTGNDESALNLSKPPQLAGNNVGHYETIEETIARLKRDVVVTGTILGIQGQESALFQIEGMEDRAFLINTQLMDGFIIKEITNTYVLLQNQVGNEAFFLYIQSNKESSPDSELEHEFKQKNKSSTVSPGLSSIPD